jgi:hypothetical protein
MPIPAGVIRYLQVPTVVAPIFMAAQDRGSAYLDGVHDPKLLAGQPMGFSISRAVLTEDLPHFQATRWSHPFCGLRNRSIERTDDLGQVEPTDMQIDGGRYGRSVTQKHLDMVETRSRLNQVGSEAVP